jgi:gamma-glutamyltranspeptidase/glutathione hydrolase
MIEAIFKGDKPIAAYGSPGGSTIINSVFQITLDLIDHGMTIQEAIDAPRISSTMSNSTGGTISRELGFSDDVIFDYLLQLDRIRASSGQKSLRL